MLLIYNYHNAVYWLTQWRGDYGQGEAGGELVGPGVGEIR